MMELILENKWLGMLILIIVLYLFCRIFHYVLFKILIKLSSLTKTDEDFKFFKKIKRTSFSLIFLIALFFFRNDLFFMFNIDKVKLVIQTVMIFYISRIAINVANLFVNISGEKFANKVDSDVDEQLLKLSNGAISFLLYAIGFIYILNIWGIEILPILGSLGIAGLAVALALQEPLQNLFGGVQILIDKNLKKGHIIQLSTGESGIIYDITLRSTRIKTWEGKLIIIPNKLMASTTITNISLPDTRRRVDVPFGVEYGTDPDYVREIIIDEMNKLQEVEKEDPAPFVLFEGMGDSSLNFSARAWVNQLSDFLPVKQKLTTQIYDRLNFEGIGIPFPQRTVWINDQGKAKNKKYSKKKFKKTKGKK